MSLELKGKSAYHAAEMFNLPARRFNAELVNGLEASGLRVFSPQRDGFEFTQLGAALQKHLPPESIEKAVHAIIFSYDVKSIWQSDVVVARYDEPPDPGVIDEILIANALNIPAVIYRTDVRSPYGSITDNYSGIHTFPVNTSQVMLMHSGTFHSIDEEMQDLTAKLKDEIGFVLAVNSARNKKTAPDFLKPTFKIVNFLFKGINNIHSKDGLEELARRYKQNSQELETLGPLWIR